MTIGNLVTSSLVDGVNVTTLLDDVLLLYSRQEVCYKKSYRNTVTVTESATFSDIRQNNFINNVNLTDFQSGVVNLKSHATLSGNYTFDHVVAGNVYVDSVNGFDLARDFLLTSGNQTMGNSMIFQQSLNFHQNLNVQRFIDGVDLELVQQDSISYNADTIIKGGMMQFSHVTTKEIKMVSNATINRIRPDELVPRTEDSVIDGTKVFGNVVTDTITSESGVINGVNVDKLVQHSLNMTRAIQHVITDQTFIQDLKVTGWFAIATY